MAFDKNRMSPAMKVVVVIFAIILVVTLTLPSLSALFSKSESQADTTTEQAQQDQPKTPQSAEEVDASFKPAIDSLEKRLQEAPTNVSLLHNMSEAYRSWGIALSPYAQDQAVKDHQNEVLQKAVDTYDKLYQQSPSNTVKTDKAVTKYYMGKTDEAIADLEAIAKEEPTTEHWANIAVLYEQMDNKEKAEEYYNKALEATDEGTEGMKEFIKARLEAQKKAENPENSSAGTEGSENSAESGTKSDAEHAGDKTESTSEKPADK